MRVAYILGRFPVVSETFVAGEIRAMEALGHEVRIFALGEGDESGRALLGGLHASVSVMSREGRARAALRIVAHALARPRRTAAGVVRSARAGGLGEVKRFLRALSWAWDPWLSSAQGIHAHFASEPARVAHRLHLATGVPFGVTGHATDLFPVAPDVGERLKEASWVVTVCEYNRAALVEALPWIDATRLHVVPCGVDAERFRRAPGSPRQAGRVVAVGRLVAKKGFADLVEASRLLSERGLDHQMRICGDGPLRAELERAIHAAGLDAYVRLLGALDHEAVRDEIERATVLALPAVIAADGDRDSMPLVLKEAMSLEVPVVGTRVAGLPEAIDEHCGRLVAPHDPAALAAALSELLSLDAEAVGEIGRRGRARVLGEFRIDRLTARFAAVLEHAA